MKKILAGIIPPSNRFVIILLLVLQCTLFAVQVYLVSLPAYGDAHTTVLTIFRQYALNVEQGQVPYRDFQMEYPPLSLVVFDMPTLFSPGTPTSYDTYRGIFAVEMCLLTLLVNFILVRIPPNHQAGQATLTVALYSMGVSILSPLLPWLYDMFPALLTIIAFMFIQGRKPFWSGLTIGLAIIAKLYPLAILPVFYGYLLAWKDWKAALRLTLGLALVAALLIPLFALDSTWPMKMLSYHLHRGLNIDSLPGGVFLLAKVAGWAEVGIVHNFGSFNIEAASSTSIASWLAPLALLSLFLVSMAGFLRFRQESQNGKSISAQSLAAYTVTALLAFILTSRVFSPQYLIWLLPFIPLIGARSSGFFLIIAAITIILYPFMYATLIAAIPASVLLLNLRNILAVALFVWLLIIYFPRRKSTR